MQKPDLITEKPRALSGLTPDFEVNQNQAESEHEHEAEDINNYAEKISYCCDQTRFLDKIMDQIQNQMSKTNQMFQEIDSGLHLIENRITSSLQNAKLSVEQQYSVNVCHQEKISAQLRQGHSEVFKLRQAAVVNAMSEGKAVGKKTE